MVDCPVFKTEIYGAVTALIHETRDNVVEVVALDNGTFDLILHRRHADCDEWDDISVALPKEKFATLGMVGVAEEDVCHAFKNRVRSLFNIDGWMLPELTQEQQREFMKDPVRCFIRTDRAQSEAIWREVEKRQVR